MTEKTLEAIVASPPERDNLVVQLFVKDGAQWGEVFLEGDSYLLELCQKNGNEVRLLPLQNLTDNVFASALQSLGWDINVEEALHVVNLAAKELASRQG